MKRSGLCLGIIVLLASCVKEKTPGSLILHNEINTKDTTYITTTIPAPQTRVILCEEATGVRCSNCPDGAKQMKNLVEQNPNKIIVAALYSNLLNNFLPPSTHDFNNKKVDSLVLYILGGDPWKPSAAINRIPTQGVLPYFFDQTVWAGTINSLLTKTTPINLELSSIPNGNEYILKSKITFTDTLTAKLAVSAYLLEDSIIDYQLDKTTDVPDYVHNHVVASILTPISGITFLDDIAQKEKGRVFERSFVFSIPTNVVNKAHCKLLCFIHKTGSDKEVLQAQEVELD